MCDEPTKRDGRTTTIKKIKLFILASHDIYLDDTD